MNWIEIIGAVGIGAVITKVLDIFWLQKAMERSEKREWLRDNRLKAFSGLSREILSFRASRGVSDYKSAFEFYGLAAESMLLIEDIKIKNKIAAFIKRFDEIFHIQNIGGDVQDSEWNKLVQESHRIVDSLSSLIMNNRKISWIKKLFKR